MVTLSSKILNERRYAINRVGIEKDVMPVVVLESLQAAFPKTEFIDVSAILIEQRVMKPKEEVELRCAPMAKKPL